MKLPETNRAQTIFNQFCTAYQNRDLATLLSLFTKNSNMWGSGVDEYRVGLQQIEEQFKRDWSQAEKCEIEVVSMIPSTPDALWMAAVCQAKITVAGEVHVFEHLRGTIIIEEENGCWKISHMHTSFPDYRNAENNSFPIT